MWSNPQETWVAAAGVAWVNLLSQLLFPSEQLESTPDFFCHFLHWPIRSLCRGSGRCWEVLRISEKYKRVCVFPDFTRRDLRGSGRVFGLSSASPFSIYPWRHMMYYSYNNIYWYCDRDYWTLPWNLDYYTPPFAIPTSLRYSQWS